MLVFDVDVAPLLAVGLEPVGGEAADLVADEPPQPIRATAAAKTVSSPLGPRCRNAPFGRREVSWRDMP